MRIDVRLVDGRTLLHLSTEQKTSSISDEFYSSFPSARVARVLLMCGSDPNQSDANGDTTLHYVARQLPAASVNVDSVNELTEIIRELLCAGAHVDVVNRANVRACDGLLSVPNVNWFAHMTLRCRAARVISASGIRYDGIIPQSLYEFVTMHGARPVEGANSVEGAKSVEGSTAMLGATRN